MRNLTYTSRRRLHKTNTASQPAIKSGAALDWRFVVLIAYLLSLAFEGPTRMILIMAKVETLLYLRDLAALTTVAIIVLTRRKENKARLNLTTLSLYIVACHSALSIWLGHPIFSVFFGIKIFLATLFGTACAQYLESHQDFIRKFIIFIFISAAIGVYVNKVYGLFPWEGSDFDSAFGSVTNSRIWWAGGERRLPGFARMFYTAAAIIGLTGVFTMSYVRNIFLKILIMAISLPAIYFTTSKGVILSFVITGAWCLIPYGPFRIRSGVWLLWACAIAALVIPLVCAYVEPRPSLMRAVPSSLTSFVERAALTWPGALADFTNWYNWILGQGVGGVGGGLRYGNEYHRFNPIDNLFLYFYTTFGLLGVAYYLFCANQIAKLANKQTEYHLALMAMGILIFSYGITAHQLEDAFEAIFFGLLIACIPVKLPEQSSRHNDQDPRWRQTVTSVPANERASRPIQS